MYMKKDEIMKKLIDKAKLSVIRSWEQKDTTDREWLEANLDSYENDSSRVKILVLEGSPAKGIVLANYGINEVSAIDGLGRHLHKWRSEDVLYESV